MTTCIDGRKKRALLSPVKKVLLAAGLVLSSSYLYAQDFEVGINVHLRKYPKPTDNYLSLIEKAGFTSYRDGFLWGMVEPKPGKFSVTGDAKKEDKAYQTGKSEYNLNGLLVLGNGNGRAGYTADGGYPRTPEAIDAFAKYAYWTASRYKGKVKYYEVWNEWTVRTGIRNNESVPSPEIYAQLVKKTSEAVKRADPNAIVMAGSLNPLTKKGLQWFDSLMKLGILDSLDGISLHPYSYKDNDLALRNPEDNLAAIDRFEQRVKKFSNKSVPMYITEIGVPTYSGVGGMTNDQAAQYAIKYTMLAKSRPYIRGVWWYDLIDDGDNPKVNEHRFGFYNRQEQPKAAAIAFGKIAEVVKAYKINNYNVSADNIISISMKEANNKNAMIYWKKTPVAQAEEPESTVKSLMNKVIGDNPKKAPIQPIEVMNSDDYVLKGGVPVLVFSEKALNKDDIKEKR
ncbi:cellulase family glycosylhydrolase [Serratia rubidaea]|uniref:cellulase family glycosylhydrolase n=1 Tax=Serratia rubidaea TaxID=61652 RepID=UPI00242E5452|nr:cellulase family glycosylhydrolase [Serratia rubidaea]MCR0999106.1 glycoside hydrolase family 5 protein [Serratia rubidaea]